MKIAIIGAGPTGLTLAHYISKHTNSEITIFDRESTVGGCHRVRRVNGSFTEHGPRIYNSNYLNFKRLLNELNLNFHDYFTEYKFTIFGITREIISKFTIREFLLLALEFFGLFYKRNLESVLEFCEKHNFSEISKKELDRVCRLTDGAGIDRYTIYELMQLPNQHAFYKVYQPNRPNDKDSWLSVWETHLKNKGVNFRLNENIKSLEQIQNYDKILFAVPPESLSPILNNVDFSNFAKSSDYEVYIPITLHYTQKLNLPEIRGSVENDWGVIWVVLSDYFENYSGTLISAAISKIDSVSSFTGKTANRSSEDELKMETLRQIRETMNLPEPEKTIISPGVYRSNSKYKTLDTAFVLTKSGFISPKISEKIYTAGTHNGKSYNAFTSLESAVSNGIGLVNEMFGNKEKILKPFELIDLIKYTFILLVLIFVYRLF